MFVLHTSNKTENLLAHLNTVLSTPLSHPFIKEHFLIQSQGMQRWLSQQLAEKKRVWANFEFHFPGKFFGNIVDQLNSGDEIKHANQESLVWHFEHLLRELDTEKNPEFNVLQHYMQGDNVDLKRYQLAEKLAYVFDQYQFMRPDWLSAWDRGQTVTQNSEEKWQQILWQQLESTSKGELWAKAIEKLTLIHKDDAIKLLPERLCVFGINGMSPIYLGFLQTISTLIDVHFFLLNPSENYWADLPNKRQLAKKIAASQLDSESLFKTHNPLLSALGQQGRDFQQLLLEQCDFELDYASFESKTENTLLAQLKNDILNNSIGVGCHKALADNSLSIHACHSRMRETEVLKDQLLKCLEDNPALGLRDIVVMTPDISQYAPYISAVFEDIPHAITDRNLIDSNDHLSIFLRFLSLSQNRWELEAVLDVVEQPVVSKKFSLVQTDLEHIRSWVSATRIRWGESADHRKELGFPAFSENSWKAGIDRLLMGYLNSDDTQFCSGDEALETILPFAEIEGSQTLALGGLYDFFSLLSYAKNIFSQPHTLKHWVNHLSSFAERLLISTDDSQQAYTALMELIEELSHYKDIHQSKVKLEVVIAWFNTQSLNHQSGAGFLRGQLTFCSMLPMRAIPFEVIALMGMNENEYPRNDTRLAFDLMAHHFRKGDKAPRIDERYQFLEVILSARKQLIITYIGQSKNTNSTIPPAVVVSELMEVLNEHYQLEENTSSLFTKHFLQAHHNQYFSDKASNPQSSKHYFSYSSHQLAIAKALTTKNDHAVKPWWRGELSVPNKNIIELRDLLAFFQHPQRHFIENQLLLKIPNIEGRADETEPFVLDSLSQYQIFQQWVERHISGNTDDQAFYNLLMAEGRWLNGSHGKISFEECAIDIQAFSQQVMNIASGKQLPPLAIDLQIDSYRVVGSLGQQYEHGNVFYRYAKLKGKDLLPAWISHLIRQQAKPAEEFSTWLVASDEQWKISSGDDNRQTLTEMLDIYTKGQQSPSALILEPAVAWQHQTNNPSVRVSPINSSLRVYKGIIEYDPFLQLLYKHLPADEVLNAEFIESCHLLSSLWQARDSFDP